MSTMRGLSFLSSLLASLFCASQSLAQSPTNVPVPVPVPAPANVPTPTPFPSPEVQPMQPGQGMMFVHVDAAERSFAVYFGRGEHPIADCTNECDFWAWPGKYRVQVRQGEARYDTTLALRIRRPGYYRFIPANGGAQNAGLILGVAGPVVGLVGLLFTTAGLLATCSDREPGQDCDKPASLYIGLAGLAVGTGMTIPGWILYARNRAHFQLIEPAPPLAPRVGVIAMPHGGLGLGATLAF